MLNGYGLFAYVTHVERELEKDSKRERGNNAGVCLRTSVSVFSALRYDLGMSLMWYILFLVCDSCICVGSVYMYATTSAYVRTQSHVYMFSLSVMRFTFCLYWRDVSSHLLLVNDAISILPICLGTHVRSVRGTVRPVTITPATS